MPMNRRWDIVAIYHARADLPVSLVKQKYRVRARQSGRQFASAPDRAWPSEDRGRLGRGLALGHGCARIPFDWDRTGQDTVRGAQAELTIWQRYTSELAEAERVSSARAGAGDTAVYDVRRVQVEQRAAEAQSARARGNAVADCATLAALTGLSGLQVDLTAITCWRMDRNPGETIFALRPSHGWSCRERKQV